MCVYQAQRRVGEAERAVQLDRGVDDVVHHVREEHFGDAVFLADVHLVFGLVRDVHQHQPRDVQLARAFGEHELHRLALVELLAERRAVGHVRGRHVERALRHRDVVHAVAQAPVRKPVLAHVEAVAFAAEQVFSRDLQVLDLDLGMAAEDVRSGPSIAIVGMSRLIL